MSEGIFKAFYDSTAWKKIRIKVLEDNYYICEYCHQAGANTVHHKIPITSENINDPAITLSLDNLVPVHKACHDKIHDRYIETQRRKIEFDDMGNVIHID